MMVSANSASCTPIEPTVAGPSARKNFRTSASSSGQRGAASAPARVASPATSRNSRIPATSTPPAAAWPAVGKNAASASATTSERLSRIGAAALQRIEDAAVERDQRDQQQIGKSDAREIDRDREALRIAREARRQHID